MITPTLVLDSREQWRPCAVETISDVGASVSGHPVDVDELPPDGGRLDFPATMTQPAASATGYHRVVTGGSLWWHQYWLWWLYNPKTYAGVGAHEGDWELVQLGCRDADGNVPVLVTLSQHDGGEKLEYWRAELRDGQPTVYVARDSHANYATVQRDVTDQADGTGSVLNAIEWREPGSWAEWPGTWGNSENSPGPLATRRAWNAPHTYHSQARG